MPLLRKESDVKMLKVLDSGEDRKILHVHLLVFFSGVLSGLVSYGWFAGYVTQLLEKVFAGVIIEDSSFKTAVNIFTRNTKVTLITLTSGVFFFAPTLILFSNGFLAGLVLKHSTAVGVSWSEIIYGTLPHAVPEISAIVFSAAYGTKIGLSLLEKHERKKAFARELKKSLRLYLTNVLPLVFIAALLEAYVSAKIIKV